MAAFRNPDPMHVPDEYGITPADREMARQRPARYKQYQERGGALTFREWFDAGMPAGGNNG